MPNISPQSSWHAVMAGVLLGLSLAAPPGPVTAVMASASVRGRVREALTMALGAMTADLTWLMLAVVGAITVLHRHPRWLGAIGLGGAALLLWMAWTTARGARQGIHRTSTPGSWKLGYLTVLTSPFSIAWWLTNGAFLYSSWGAPGIAGMFAAVSGYSVAFVYAFRWLGTKAASAMIVAVAYVSSTALAGFGLYVGWTSLTLITT